VLDYIICPQDNSLYVFSCRDNDRLLGINWKVVTYWDHRIVLESLKYLLFYSEPSERLSLVSKTQL